MDNDEIFKHIPVTPTLTYTPRYDNFFDVTPQLRWYNLKQLSEYLQEYFTQIGSGKLTTAQKDELKLRTTEGLKNCIIQDSGLVEDVEKYSDGGEIKLYLGEVYITATQKIIKSKVYAQLPCNQKISELSKLNKAQRINVRGRIKNYDTLLTENSWLEKRWLYIYDETFYSDAVRVETDERIKQQNSACFIATAVYGDVNHPQIEHLRIFRDKILLKNYFGRLFIEKYYYYSPGMATSIRESALLKVLTKLFIIKPMTTLAKCFNYFLINR